MNDIFLQNYLQVTQIKNCTKQSIHFEALVKHNPVKRKNDTLVNLFRNIRKEQEFNQIEIKKRPIDRIEAFQTARELLENSQQQKRIKTEDSQTTINSFFKSNNSPSPTESDDDKMRIKENSDSETENIKVEMENIKVESFRKETMSDSSDTENETKYDINNKISAFNDDKHEDIKTKILFGDSDSDDDFKETVRQSSHKKNSDKECNKTNKTDMISKSKECKKNAHKTDVSKLSRSSQKLKAKKSDASKNKLVKDEHLGGNKQKIGQLVVHLLMPAYSQKKFESKDVFKSVARKISHTILDKGFTGMDTFNCFV